MRQRIKLWLTTRTLEQSFLHCWVRLAPAERDRVLDGLGQPFRRQWYVVDGRGVRRLGDDE